MSNWEGPYIIIEKLSDLTYRIKWEKKRQPKIVNVNRLWAYHGPGDFTWTRTQPSEAATGSTSNISEPDNNLAVEDESTDQLPAPQPTTDLDINLRRSNRNRKLPLRYRDSQ